MGTIRVTLLMTAEFLEKARKSAKERGMSLSGYIRFAISELEKGK